VSTIYDLTTAARAIADSIYDAEGDPERDAIIDAQVLAWIDAASDKGEACAAVHRRLSTEAQHWRTEASRLMTLARRADRSAGLVTDRATALVLAAEELGGEGVRVGPLRMQANAGRVVIDDPRAIPETLMVVKSEPNKAAIAALIKAGSVCPGAHIEPSRSIRGL
jgi:hypothetical protein